MSIQIVTVGSPNYTAGRVKRPRLIVIHTAECGCNPGAAVAVAKYLSNPSVRASAHWMVGPDLAVAQVAEADTAWAAPGANADGIQIEQTAFAGWSTEWLTGGQVPLDMLRNTAEVMAGISQRWNIPLVHLTNDQLANGASGVIGHVQASEVYQASDHWDPGPNYPYDHVLDLARQFAGGFSPAGTVAPAEPPDEWSALMADPANVEKLNRIHDVVVAVLGTYKPSRGLGHPPNLAELWDQSNAGSTAAERAAGVVDAAGKSVNVISQQMVGLATKIDAKAGKALADYSDEEILAEAFRRQNKGKAAT